MILLLDTSTPTCRVTLVSDVETEYEWEAGRGLAKDLLGFLEESLAKSGATFQDLTGLGVFRGPGSFTGLRIGITVMNTLAQSLSIPIVGELEEDWKTKVLSRLEFQQNGQIVLPEYGGEAHITTPRK